MTCAHCWRYSPEARETGRRKLLGRSMELQGESVSMVSQTTLIVVILVLVAICAAILEVMVVFGPKWRARNRRNRPTR